MGRGVESVFGIGLEHRRRHGRRLRKAALVSINFTSCLTSQSCGSEPPANRATPDGRRIALGTEVVARLHEADAEELLPEAVDRDPR